MNVCKTSRKPQFFIKNIASLDNPLLARQEPIADPMHSFNVGGIALIIVQLAAQLGHSHGYVVAVGVLVHPYRLTDALGSENNTGIPRKERKQPKLSPLKCISTPSCVTQYRRRSITKSLRWNTMESALSGS